MSGSGGGSSGAVSYPDYMEDLHYEWLNNSGDDTLTSSMTDIMDAALGNSPWTDQEAYDPDTDINAMLSAEDELQTLVTLLSNGTTLDTLISNILDSTRVSDSVDAYAADLDVRLTTEVLPRFERGMQDINAVSSSAFVIGRALIEEGQDRQVALYSAGLYLKSFSDDALKVIQLKLEYQRIASAMLIESYRMKIVAKREENEVEMKIDEADIMWDLGVFQHGANLLAGISGGTSGTNAQASTWQSAIGGGMSGAAAGANVGGQIGSGNSGWGAAIGGVLGAASAFL